MSVFNPELRENRETKWEANKFSPEMKKKLLHALDAGRDTFPDIIQCPNQACGNPLRIEIKEDSILVHCSNCGWEELLRRNDV